MDPSRESGRAGSRGSRGQRVLNWGLVLALPLVLGTCESGGAEGSSLGQAQWEERSSASTVGDRPSHVPPRGAADLARLRAATAEYHDFTKALSAGFVDASGTQECVAHPELGGMGIHYVHFDRFGDLAIDPTRPEILLYVPHREGRMELVGAEFAVNAEAWHAAFGDDVLPEVAGVRFDPPDPQALNPLPQTSYTLHVWLWKENPAGLFAPFNPNVVCG